MGKIHVSSGEQQVTDHLQQELQRGRWTGTMPGRARLAVELGVSGDLVDAALQRLEREGWLVSQGPRKRRLINLNAIGTAALPLRVGIFYYSSSDRQLDYFIELAHQLDQKGCVLIPAARPLMDLGMNVQRVARVAEQVDVDAWLVVAGSREILDWFSKQPIPAFAIHGRRGPITIGGINAGKSDTMVVAVRRLADLGHRRIVLLTKEERRKPQLGIVERAFIGELEKQNIPVGSYNLPDFKDNEQSFQNCLKNLFNVTPPTAVIADGVWPFTALQQFLLHRGIRVPQDISVVCLDPNPAFEWCYPAISHFSYDNRVWVRNIMRWVDKVATGTNDRRLKICASKFIEGGTIGPAPKTQK